MSIYRCNSCGFIAEIAQIDGQSTHCGRCAKTVTIYGTVFFVEKILQRYAESLRENKRLKEELSNIDQDNRASVATTIEDENRAKKSASTTFDPASLPSKEQHFPLMLWFKTRQLNADFQYENVDLSGCFDEAARQIVEHSELMSDLLGKISWSYRKGHTSINIDLSRSPQNHIGVITKLCRSWYSASLFSKYFYQKNEKVLRLGLQAAIPVRQFFTGGWLEWFVLDAVLKLQLNFKQAPISIARGAKIQFPNEDVFELDVVALFGKKLLVIECKSGEFRNEIDRLSRLQKRLGLDARSFLVCSPQLDDAQAKSMSAMYGMTFVNLDMLESHIQHTLVLP